LFPPNRREKHNKKLLSIITVNKGLSKKKGQPLYYRLIIFFCTFDYVNAGLSVYTFKTTCTENGKILLPDGITKVILNCRAAAKTQKPELQAFLDYMNGKKVTVILLSNSKTK